MLSIREQDNEVMRVFVSKGIFDPRLHPLRKHENRYGSLVGPIMKLAQSRVTSQQRRELGTQSSWQLPTTRRFIQSKSPDIVPIVHPSGGPYPAWMVETSRLTVPYGSIGIVKSFEQYLATEQTVYSSQSNWGNPFPSQSGTWYLRLSPAEYRTRPWISVVGPSADSQYLPGIPYNDFDSTRGMWYPAGGPQAANIHLPIPGAYMLRVFFITAEHDVPLSVASRLTGTVQSETSSDAQFVVRTSW